MIYYVVNLLCYDFDMFVNCYGYVFVFICSGCFDKVIQVFDFLLVSYLDNFVLCLVMVDVLLQKGDCSDVLSCYVVLNGELLCNLLIILFYVKVLIQGMVLKVQVEQVVNLLCLVLDISEDLDIFCIYVCVSEKVGQQVCVGEVYVDVSYLVGWFFDVFEQFKCLFKCDDLDYYVCVCIQVWIVELILLVLELCKCKVQIEDNFDCGVQ